MLVYRIINQISGKCYVGSTDNFDRRKYEHIISSTSQSYDSYNYPLQKAFRKYGLENFTFEIVEDNIDPNDIAQKEQYYIIYFNSLVNTGHGYNQTLFADCALRDPYYKALYIETYGKKCAEVNNNNQIIAQYNSLHEAARALNIVGSESKIKAICDGKQNSYYGRIFRYIVDGKIVTPKPLTRPRRNRVCGISIYDRNDVVYYDSVSDAAKHENIERSSVSKCIAGEKRYTCVGKRIWRKLIGEEIIENEISITDIIIKYSGYCAIDYTAQKIYTADTLKELSQKSGVGWGKLQKNIKSGKITKGIGCYKLDEYKNPIIKKEGM